MFQGLLSSKAGEEDGFRVLGSGWEGLANHLRSGHGCCPSEATTKVIAMSVSVALPVVCSGVKALSPGDPPLPKICSWSEH